MLESSRSKSAHPAEAALVARAAGGEREAFAQLVHKHEASLQRYLRLISPSIEDAEELAQESFLRAWSRLDRYDPRWRFSTWLFTLARRLAASRARRLSDPLGAGHDFAGLGGEEDPARELDERELGRQLWTLARRVLPREQFEGLWLRYVEDLGASEIGRVLDRRPGAVRVLLHRARLELAGRLDPRLAEEPAPRGEARPLLGLAVPGRVLEGGLR